MNETVGRSWYEIAKSAYKAYAASTGNKNFRGEPMPEFEDLPRPIKTAWEAAVREASNSGSNHDSQQRWAGWQSPSCPVEELKEPDAAAYPEHWQAWYKRVNDCGKVRAREAWEEKISHER